MLVKTTAATMVPTMMMMTPRTTLELAEWTEWTAAALSFSLEAARVFS